MKRIRLAFERLIKCWNCKDLVPDAKFCITCGVKLRKDS